MAREKVTHDDEELLRATRRARKYARRRSMKVSGRSVRQLQRLIIARGRAQRHPKQ